MSISLVNSTSASSDLSAEFRLFMGSSPVARIGVHAGARAVIPTASSFTVQACTSMGQIQLSSNTVNLSSQSANLLAQVLVENGYYDFQLTSLPGTEASALRFENTWIEPVTFKVMMPGSPMKNTIVIDEHNAASLSTARRWSCYAIVNGITTAQVITTDPNGTITLFADNNDEAFRLVVT